MKFLSYFTCLIIGLLISSVGMYLAYASAPEHFVAMLGLLSLIYIAVIVFVGKKTVKAEGKNYSILLITPFFLFTAILQVFSVAGSSLGLLSPNSTAFDEACKDVGTQYFKKPSMPVRSVAFDWDGEDRPDNHFNVIFGTRVANLGYSSLGLGNDLEFIETKRSRYETWASGGIIRSSRDTTENASAITADVLVRYRVIPIIGVSKIDSDKLFKYEVLLSDRRNLEKLAMLRYAVDSQKMRGCGLTEPNALDVSNFVRKAIGTASPIIHEAPTPKSNISPQNRIFDAEKIEETSIPKK